MEKIVNELVNYKNLKIVQCKNYFNFSLESILLPNFVKIKKYKNIIDLGCGNAPIPLILSTIFEKSNIIGVELQKEIYDLAIETLKINGKLDDIKILNMNIKELKKLYKHNSFDLVLSNPPYFSKEEKKEINENKIKAIARHEIEITLEEIIKTASYLLNNKGSFYLVHRTEKLNLIFELLTKNNIEPKRVRFIYPKKGSPSNLVLIEGIKSTGKGLKVEKPLIVHNNNGKYSEEINNIFKGVNNDSAKL